MPDDEIKVEQCDREAAAAYWKVSRIGNSETQRRYLSGEADNALIVQAFARHRIQHGAQGEWQPIDTAPKDGTFIQLFEPIAHPPVSVGCYDDEAGWLIGEADFMPSKCRPRCWAPLLPRPDIVDGSAVECAQREPDLATIAYMSGAYDGRKDMEAQLAEAQREIARLREALRTLSKIDDWIAGEPAEADEVVEYVEEVARAALEKKL